MNKKNLIISLVITALFAADALPQQMKYGYFRNTDINAQAGLQTWDADGERITEFYLPVTFIYPVTPKLVINAGTSTAFASLTSASKSLGGLTDTRINASYVTMNDQLLITGGIALPTGKTTLEGDQNLVASALALHPLSFRVPSFGQGFTLNLFGYYAMKVENFVVGGGAGFVFKNGFAPLSNSDATYKPGMEFSINAGGETNANNRAPWKFTADLTITFYGADTYDSKEVFKSGTKLILDLRALTKMKNADLLFFVRERTKGRNDKGYGSLTTETKNSNGNQLEGGGIIYTPLNENLGLKGLVDVKFYSKNEYESNGAVIFGGGVGFNYMLNRTVTIDALFKYSAGNLNNKSVSTKVTGLEIGGGIKYRL